MNRITYSYRNQEVPFETYMQCVGKGWHDILLRLYDDLVDLGWDYSLLQVKEKFGGLRFYIGLGSNEIHERISQAERESLETCEECGQPGTLEARSFWVRTLCPTHAEEYIEGIKKND